MAAVAPVRTAMVAMAAMAAVAPAPLAAGTERKRVAAWFIVFLSLMPLAVAPEKSRAAGERGTFLHVSDIHFRPVCHAGDRRCASPPECRPVARPAFARARSDDGELRQGHQFPTSGLRAGGLALPLPKPISPSSPATSWPMSSRPRRRRHSVSTSARRSFRPSPSRPPTSSRGCSAAPSPAAR